MSGSPPCEFHASRPDFSNAYLRFLVESGEYQAWHASHLQDVIDRDITPEIVDRTRVFEAEESLRGQREARPLAVVLDIDETLICNIHDCKFVAAEADGAGPVDFHAADFFAGEGGPWPRDQTELGPILPKARELLEAIHRRGVAIMLVSGRRESLREVTVRNLEFHGLVGPDAIFRPEMLAKGENCLYLCPDDELPGAGGTIRPFKHACRQKIGQTHRIMLNIGDQPSDLGMDADRCALLPNPFYYTT